MGGPHKKRKKRLCINPVFAKEQILYKERKVNEEKKRDIKDKERKGKDKERKGKDKERKGKGKSMVINDAIQKITNTWQNLVARLLQQTPHKD